MVSITPLVSELNDVPQRVARSKIFHSDLGHKGFCSLEKISARGDRVSCDFTGPDGAWRGTAVHRNCCLYTNFSKIIKNSILKRETLSDTGDATLLDCVFRRGRADLSSCVFMYSRITFCRSNP